jgi:PIN domain nuclease of toxin-antitoxin system
MESRSYLDTHVVAWLLGEDSQKVSSSAREAISASSELCVSPMVRLELQFMHEIGRLAHPASVVLAEGSRQLGLRVDDRWFEHIAIRATGISWTRDPFDRLIVAHAMLDDAPLISKDRLIRKHYPKAVW